MLKAAPLSLASLSPSVENLVLQPGAELSSLRGLYSGMASARINLMFLCECVAISHHT